MNLDNQTLIHVAAEVTLIAGLGFWMKKRADYADAKIEELEAKLKKYEEVIMQQQNLLARHEGMLRQIFGQPDVRSLQDKPPQNSSSQGSSQTSSPPNPPNPPPEEEEDVDAILRRELAREDEKSIEVDTVTTIADEKKASPTALKQRKTKKKTVNVRKT